MAFVIIEIQVADGDEQDEHVDGILNALDAHGSFVVAGTSEFPAHKGEWSEYHGIEFCAVERCPNTLDDGEGWDGYCGTHADLIH